MTTAKIILAGTAVLAIVSSAALAQDAQKGTITKIDRIHVAAIGDVSRAKLYYLRQKVGKKARVREKQR